MKPAVYAYRLQVVDSVDDDYRETMAHKTLERYCHGSRRQWSASVKYNFQPCTRQVISFRTNRGVLAQAPASIRRIRKRNRVIGNLTPSVGVWLEVEM